MNWTCQYCGKDTKWIDSEYLVDTDHLQCVLIEQLKNDKTNMPPKSLLDILDIQDNRITIKNLNKILTLSVKNKSMIQLFSAEEIGVFGNVYEFKGIVGKQHYVFDLHRNPDTSVGNNYFTLALTHPQNDSVLIQKEWISEPMKLIAMMEQLIMSNKPLIN
jgi:hypothetical protein